MSRSGLRERNAQKQPMRNTIAKKRARQEDVDSGYLFANSLPFVQGFPSEHAGVDLVHTPLPKLALQGAQRQIEIPTKLVFPWTSSFPVIETVQQKATTSSFTG